MSAGLVAPAASQRPPDTAVCPDGGCQGLRLGRAGCQAPSPGPQRLGSNGAQPDANGEEVTLLGMICGDASPAPLRHEGD